ncbi:hypothetical protein BDZ89DRAFT_72280 [Hymenopellis radicata]|nr:hypothetical protein BDZ89DRAFT_72280 [Hymenopellis radicata]
METTLSRRGILMSSFCAPMPGRRGRPRCFLHLEVVVERRFNRLADEFTSRENLQTQMPGRRGHLSLGLPHWIRRAPTLSCSPAVFYDVSLSGRRIKPICSGSKAWPARPPHAARRRRSRYLAIVVSPPRFSIFNRRTRIVCFPAPKSLAGEAAHAARPERLGHIAAVVAHAVGRESCWERWAHLPKSDAWPARPCTLLMWGRSVPVIASDSSSDF